MDVSQSSHNITISSHSTAQQQSTTPFLLRHWLSAADVTLFADRLDTSSANGGCDGRYFLWVLSGVRPMGVGRAIGPIVSVDMFECVRGRPSGYADAFALYLLCFEPRESLGSESDYKGCGGL